ncbi:PREDICTED: CUB and sushi domain-containing protein 3-like [Branchiostoma belcheri]|uniref:CUB and sushi domain-containing protein 3-like n=1 Tax=Branchiostoma belcheri TaxID=7741 RepID=A0A6P4YC81_BRABE|nr:PREDICTED: CUB and sushi domain-containing protein 3-like [Branchiostoma belcheri]
MDAWTAFGNFKATFTTLGTKGRLGPTDLGQHYSGQDHDGLVTLNNGIQHFTVKHTGTYQIEAAGDVLKILVGQEGGWMEEHACYFFKGAGGGGGTFVTRDDNTPLIIAGGGGITSSTGCGEFLRASSGGPITSPNYPNDYGSYENCVWSITVPEGSIIRLTFDSFKTQDEFDVLTIIDDAKVVQRLSGYHQQISPVISISNTMLLKFTSDGSMNYQGFRFSYISSTAGQCWDPGLPTNGIRDTNGNFTSGQTVRYTCVSNYLLSGTANITCHSNGTWSDATPTCKQGYKLTAPSGGPVTSPNYPSVYGNNENVEWSITVPEGSIIRLTFDSFLTQSGFDFLTIYDGASNNSEVLQRLTGYHQQISPIISTSNMMFLRFTSDDSVTRQGFQFSYIMGGSLTAHSGGPFTSPNYPSNYGSDDNYEWSITVPKGSIIRLTFDSFETLKGFHFLTIYDGASANATELQRLSGRLHQISPIISTSNMMLLKFTSEGYLSINPGVPLTGQGFQFSYISNTAGQCWDPGVPANGNRDNNSNFTSGQTVRYTCITGYQLSGNANITCQSNGTWSDATPTCEGNEKMTLTLTGPSGGPVTSLNYPSNYGNNENTEWLITVPKASIIRLTFDGFSTESQNDFLTIYDGASNNAKQLLRLTGHRSKISPIISTSNMMFLRFTSDDSVTYQGFQFSYIMGVSLTAPSGGPVTSPNYPSNYNNNQRCEWSIIVAEGSIIRLSFDSFNTQLRFDILTIYDGASDDATVLQRLSGYHQQISPIISTSNMMFLRFTSNYYYTSQGFQFSYISSTAGQCWDPGLPTDGTRDNNRNFTSGQAVRYTCMDGYHLWGTANITCQSNGTWSDSLPTCEVPYTLKMGASLTSPSGGPMTSQNYPNNYGNHENVRWLITTPEGSIIRLTFDSFETKKYDILTIYDGASDDAGVLQRLSGYYHQISPIISTSNTMFLRFTSDCCQTSNGFQFSYISKAVLQANAGIRVCQPMG